MNKNLIVKFNGTAATHQELSPIFRDLTEGCYYAARRVLAGEKDAHGLTALFPDEVQLFDDVGDVVVTSLRAGFSIVKEYP